jgi:predicted HTH domain antitoxin
MVSKGITMRSITVEVQIPEALRELGISDEEIRREVPLLLVLKRFRQGQVSSGKAAELLGISRRDFLDLLAKERVPIYDPGDQELIEEFETIRRLGSSSS